MAYTSYNTTFGGMSVQPTVTARYEIIGSTMCHVQVTHTVDGTSIESSPFLFLLPFRAARNFIQNNAVSLTVDNSAAQATTGRMILYPGSNVAGVYLTSVGSSLWTATGGKSISFSFVYQINDPNEVFESNDGVGQRPGIICGGQSNLGTGVTTVASSLEAGYKQTYLNIRFGRYAEYSSAYIPTVQVAAMDYSKNPTYQSPDQNGTYSLQFYLLPQVQALVDRNLYVCWHGIGNTSLVADWKASSDIGNEYSQILFKSMALSQRVKDVDGSGIANKFYLMVQGEKDGRVLADANNYETNLTAFVNNFRSHSGFNTIPFVIMKLNTETITAPSNPVTYAAIVNTAIDIVADTLADVYTVSPEGATMHTDKIHYSAAGELELANRIMTVINANSLMS